MGGFSYLGSCFLLQYDKTFYFTKKKKTCFQGIGNSDCKPDEWWDTNPEYLIKLVKKGDADYLFDYLNAELFPAGIVLTARSISMKRKDRLSCSAIAWA